MVLRFANAIFEPLWNSKYISHIQITCAENLGMEGGRGGYYDKSGALRDMVQNHLLQLLSLVAMEPPTDLTADGVRDEKVKVIRSLRQWDTPEKVAENVIRAQYTAGHVDGNPVPGYREEDRVDPESKTGGLRRRPPADRHLALERRAVLHPHGQAPAEEVHRDLRAFQGRRRACFSTRSPAAFPAATCSSSASSRTKASRCAWSRKSPAPACALSR